MHSLSPSHLTSPSSVKPHFCIHSILPGSPSTWNPSLQTKLQSEVYSVLQGILTNALSDAVRTVQCKGEQKAVSPVHV